MLFRGKRTVEKDLERIRRANLSDEEREAEDKAAEEEKQNAKETMESLTAKDYLAMAIAALSIVIPYALIIIGVMALIWFLIYKFYLGM